MKKLTPNGAAIKRLRTDRERGATQKELAYEAQISERKLRAIENRNDASAADALDRLAKALGVRREAIVFAEDRPRLVQARADIKSDGRSPELVIAPRIDDEILSAVTDDAELLRSAASSHGLVTHFMTKLSPEVEGYATDLLELLESVTREQRDDPIQGREELGLRRRVRELLVLLKGNDVWVYATFHFKHQPEGDEALPRPEFRNVRVETIIAFGPPGEYGETTIRVRVDHGRPWAYSPTKLSS